MSYKDLPRKERVCVNCRHYLRNITPYALFALLIDDGQEFHRCTKNKIVERFNTITGKKKIKIEHVSCLSQKGYLGACDEENRSWEPSEKWKKKKENLFKVLEHLGEK